MVGYVNTWCKRKDLSNMDQQESGEYVWDWILGITESKESGKLI